jgi:hypothetical protein
MLEAPLTTVGLHGNTIVLATATYCGRATVDLEIGCTVARNPK